MFGKRGRPEKYNKKECRVTVRMTHGERYDLDELCRKTGKTQSEIMLEGLNMVDRKYSLFN